MSGDEKNMIRFDIAGPDGVKEVHERASVSRDDEIYKILWGGPSDLLEITIPVSLGSGYYDFPGRVTVSRSRYDDNNKLREVVGSLVLLKGDNESSLIFHGSFETDKDKYFINSGFFSMDL
ncbi:hypothetical protein D3C77_417240 [compost metagenome]